jgi:tetratricopeptide (TPR) repeat protein
MRRWLCLLRPRRLSIAAADPSYAVALGALAECWISKATRGTAPMLAALEAARLASDRALALDPLLVSARAARAWLTGVKDRHTREAFQIFDDALAIDPNYANAYFYRSWVHRVVGDHDAALRDLDRCIAARGDQDAFAAPRSLELYWARQYDEALKETYRRPISFQSTIALGAFRTAIASTLGRHDEAIASGIASVAAAGRQPTILTVLAHALANAGRREEAILIVEEILGSASAQAIPSFLAAPFVALNRHSEALGWLEHADREGCIWLGGALSDPRFDPIRTDSRFKALAMRRRDRQVNAVEAREPPKP